MFIFIYQKEEEKSFCVAPDFFRILPSFLPFYYFLFFTVPSLSEAYNQIVNNVFKGSVISPIVF